MPHAYILVLPVDPITEETPYTTLPLHCTLMLWFEIAKEPKELVEELRSVVQSLGLRWINLRSEKFAWFGKDNDVPVHTLVEDVQLRRLHHRIHLWLVSHGTNFLAPEWVGNGFRAHVSTVAERVFGPGCECTAREIYVIAAPSLINRRIKRVVGKVDLAPL